MNGTKAMTPFSALAVTALILIAAASAASAHDDHCAAVTDSVADAGFDEQRHRHLHRQPRDHSVGHLSGP